MGSVETHPHRTLRQSIEARESLPPESPWTTSNVKSRPMSAPDPDARSLAFLRINSVSYFEVHL